MNLIDAGPLIALNDREDPAHDRCTKAAADCAPAEFATTWPCVAEAMHILKRAGGFPLQAALWRMIRSGLVVTADLSAGEAALAESLMDQYQSLPMDLADATLVALADYRGWKKVLTLDSHFYAYRLHDGSALDVILPAKE